MARRCPPPQADDDNAGRSRPTVAERPAALTVAAVSDDDVEDAPHPDVGRREDENVVPRRGGG